MKTLYTAKGVYLLIIAMVGALAGKAQTSLEFASGGGPVGAGESISLGRYPTGIYLISVKENGRTQLIKVFRE